MKRYFGILGLGFALLFPACSTLPPKPVLLEKANVLPLQLDDAFEFRKNELFVNKPFAYLDTKSEAIAFERNRYNWGAITRYDFDERTGNFFEFFWRAKKTADITVRLEYRQMALGNYVQAQELYYPGAHGSNKSEFQVTGDDFLENGRVSAWRALMIVDGKIVAITQSYMWK